MKSFWECKRSTRLLVLFGAICALSLVIWLVVCALAFLLDGKIPKTGAGFLSILGDKQSGYYFLVSFVCCAMYTIFLYFKGHKKFGGRFSEKIEATDFEAKWLDQSELEKKIVVLKDNVQASYPTWCIEGVEGVKDSKNKPVNDISYHILAADKYCLEQKFKKDNREPIINGGKPLKQLIAGATITIGAARSGKTQQIIKPTILHLLKNKHKSSMVICDVKGDIFKLTSKLAEDNGYRVMRFNSTNAKFSHSWNVLGEIWDLYYNEYLPNWEKDYKLKNSKSKSQPNDLGYDISAREKFLDARGKIQQNLDIIVKTIAPVDPNSRDKFFDKKAQNLIKLYFLLPLDFGIEKNDYTIFNIASNGLLYKKKLTVFRDMLPLWALSKIYSVEFEQIDGRTSLQDVEATAQNTLELFTLQEVKNLTTPNEKSIDFNEFIKKPTVLYISIDVSNTKDATSSNKIAILFMEMLYSHLQNYLTKRNLNYFENPILFIIDEFGNLPRMNFMLQLFSLDQGKNIIPHLVIQSLSQLDKTYSKNDRQILFDSTQCFFLCSGVNKELAEFLSSKSGKFERRYTNKNINDDGKVSHSISTQQVQSINYDEFMNIIPNKEIVIAPIGMKPTKINIIPAERVKWIIETTNSLNIAQDVSYGKTINTEEIDFFKDILNPDIVKYWCYKYNNKNVSQYRRELASELGQEPWFEDFNDVGRTNENKFKKAFNDYGGYPCLALKLINAYEAEKTPELKNKKSATQLTNINLDNQVEISTKTNKINDHKKNSKINNLKKVNQIEINSKDIKTKLRQSLKGIKDFSNIYSKTKTISTVNIQNYMFLLPIYDSDKLERYFKDENTLEKLLDAVKNNKKYGLYWKIWDERPINNDLTPDYILKQFGDIAKETPSAENICYITKFIDLYIYTWQNSQEAISSNGDEKIMWDELKVPFEIPDWKLMKQFYEELKNWQEKFSDSLNYEN